MHNANALLLVIDLLLGKLHVDVRDIADMHLRALSRPQSAGRRIVGADRFFRLPDMAQILAAAHPDRKITRRQAPDWLVRIVAMVDKPVRSIVPRLGQTDEISNRHAQDLLGMSFIDVADSLRATSAFLVNRGLVDR